MIIKNKDETFPINLLKLKTTVQKLVTESSVGFVGLSESSSLSKVVDKLPDLSNETYMII